MTNDKKVEALRRELEEITKLGEDLGNALRRVEALERALQRAVDLYGKPGGPWNVPTDPGGWLAMARAALGEKGE